MVDAADLNRLIEIGRRQHQLLNEAYTQTVAVLASALESRDFGTSRHSRRVTSYATRLTLEVAPGLLDDPSLEWGFLLHDVGKIGIPDGILLKPGRLTAPERRRMQEHAELGERLLAHVPLLNQEGARVIRSHHERWDGNGYPDRLSEESIPLGARIFAVVDSLDAMTDKRPYRAPGQLGGRRRGDPPLPRQPVRPRRRRRLRGVRARALPPAHGGARRLRKGREGGRHDRPPVAGSAERALAQREAKVTGPRARLGVPQRRPRRSSGRRPWR